MESEWGSAAAQGGGVASSSSRNVEQGHGMEMAQPPGANQ